MTYFQIHFIIACVFSLYEFTNNPYSFGEFTSLTDDVSYMQTKNYFEVRFIPTWLEKEFMSIDFDYSFDDFGIKNATEDELTID